MTQQRTKAFPGEIWAAMQAGLWDDLSKAAEIDKIFGTIEQYDELVGWIKANRPEIEKFLYSRADLIRACEQSKGGTGAISVFPYDVDMWLLGHCPLIWVTDRIKIQYDVPF